MESKSLSVCLSVINFDPNYLTTGKTEWAEIFLGHLWQKYMSQTFLFVRKVADKAWAEGQNSNILTKYSLQISNETPNYFNG